jgi:hypothetical protein
MSGANDSFRPLALRYTSDLGVDYCNIDFRRYTYYYDR